MENVVDEVRRLVASGTRYVTLLGQTVDAWRESGKKFCDLLERTAEEVPRVWFTTSHPSNMEDRTLRLIGEKETLVKKLHLPVQSGSDRMLKIMHRGYKSERYRRKIEVFREAVPDGTLSTDIIVGHPGETEQDHEETLRLVEDCRFDSAYIFKFSPRRGTEAAEYQGHHRRESPREGSWKCCEPWNKAPSTITRRRSARSKRSTLDMDATGRRVRLSARPGAAMPYTFRLMRNPEHTSRRG